MNRAAAQSAVSNQPGRLFFHYKVWYTQFSKSESEVQDGKTNHNTFYADVC